MTNDIQNFAMIQKKPVNLNLQNTDSKNCAVCQDLLMYMERLLDMLNITRRSTASDWLTVDNIAKELKVSKSIIYRLIRHGELEAVDIVETNGKIAKKGHYRIERSNLNRYLESKKVRQLPDQPKLPRSRRMPTVKNHLGL